MAVAENAPKFDDTVAVSKENDVENPIKPRNDDSSGVLSLKETDFQAKNGKDGDDQKDSEMGQMQNGYGGGGGDGDESFKQDMRDLEDLLSKLNPMAEEFVPPSLGKIHGYPNIAAGFGYAGNILFHINNPANANGLMGRKVTFFFFLNI